MLDMIRSMRDPPDTLPAPRKDVFYEWLRSDVREFRLLRLEPGRNNDPLLCSLRTESLMKKGCPAYETISYHWGGRSAKKRTLQSTEDSSSEQSCIEIAGRTVEVPTAAGQALKCMRLPNEARMLWIDSICIDQDNLEERGQQIALMGDIYRKGTRNLIHLGVENTDEASAGVRALSQAFKRLQHELNLLPEDVQGKWRDHRIKPDGWGKLEMPPVLAEDPELIKAMFKCAWFTRLWVVQEACLASENICHWAKETFDLQDLMDVVHISRELEVSGDNEIAEVYRTYCCLQQLRYPLLISRQFREGNIENPIEAMTILIDSVRQCDVSHRYDRIFAVSALLRSLPGVSAEATKLLEADYSKSLTEVFRDATRAILLSSGADELLTRLSHRSSLELNEPMKASWSFYWERPSDLVHEAGRPPLYTTFHAGIPETSLRSPRSMVIGATGADPDILSLRGFLLGPVKNFRPHAKTGTLFQDSVATESLIETIVGLARAGPQPQWNERLAESAQMSMQAEALRMREIERANEVIRRRLSRKIGNMEIKAYSDRMLSRANSFSQPEELPHEEKMVILPAEDCIDLASMTVLTANWWRAQFAEYNTALRAFRALREHLKRHEALPHVLSDAFNMYMVIAASSNNRCFFTTAHGDVGCGPKIMEAEDVVAVFVGAKYPYVLRRSSSPGEVYRLVGMAIVPGIMHGEVFGRNPHERTFRLC